MGLSNSMIRIFVLLCTSALFNPCLAENNVALEKQPWPNAASCHLCVPIQFGKLDMRLPLAEIGKIVITGSEDSALHILPKRNASQESVLFLTIKPDRLINRYQKSGLLRDLGITTNEQFFDALGKPPEGNKALATIRHIESLDTTNHYLKTSKKSVHVYWIQSSLPGGSQRVYFVMDGDKTVYLLAGNVSRIFYEAVLSHLRIADVP